MARDYKHVARNGPGGKRRPSKGSTSRRTPGWVWLLTGLCVGLLITLGVYLYNRNHEAQLAKQAAALAKAAETQQGEGKAKSGAAPQKEEEQRFDFYTLLPRQEVVIPESEIREEQQRLEAKDNVIYTLQAGSFHSHEEADTLKARLALLGVESQIITASNEDGTRHKVRIGPLSNSREMNRIRNRLNSNHISTIVLRQQKTK